MADKSFIRAEAARLLARFEQAGAQVIEADILQPAGTLLDLYGEDIRARAYVTNDPVMGEAMLRPPDFTVPVVQMHMTNGAEPARYAYMGEVFRAQEEAAHRAPEHFQVGYELFERDSPPAADAEVFSVISQSLRGGWACGLPLVIWGGCCWPLCGGDLGRPSAARLRSCVTSGARAASGRCWTGLRAVRPPSQPGAKIFWPRQIR